MTSGKMYIWAYTQYQLKKSAMKDSSLELIESVKG